MAILNDPQLISEMKEWLKELSREQGERQRLLTELMKEKEIIDEKVICLWSISVEESDQQDTLNEMIRDNGQEQKVLREKIEELEKEINVNEGLNKKITDRVEMMIKERGEQYTVR